MTENKSGMPDMSGMRFGKSLPILWPQSLLLGANGDGFHVRELEDERESLGVCDYLRADLVHDAASCAAKMEKLREAVAMDDDGRGLSTAARLREAAWSIGQAATAILDGAPLHAEWSLRGAQALVKIAALLDAAEGKAPEGGVE